jgi:large subunit ribosomal protein L4
VTAPQRARSSSSTSGPPKTKSAKAALAALGIDGKALVVVNPNDANTIRSFLNLPEVQLIEVNELNAYDVLCSDWIVFSKSTLPGEVTETAAAPAKKAPAKKAAAKKAPAKVEVEADAAVESTDEDATTESDGE